MFHFDTIMVSLGILMTMCFDIMLKYIQTDITLFCHHYLVSVGFLRYCFILTSLIRKTSVQVASAKKSFEDVKHGCEHALLLFKLVLARYPKI